MAEANTDRHKRNEPAASALLQCAIARGLLPYEQGRVWGRKLKGCGHSPEAVRERLRDETDAVARALLGLLPPKDMRNLGQWHRLARLNEGAFATTWLGSGYSGELVVIKVLHGDRLPSEQTDAFIADIEPILGLDNRYLVPYIDVGATHDDRAFLVAEQARGIDLGRRIRERGPYPEGRMLNVSRHIAKGIRELEKIGRVHGLVGPQNIMIDRHRRARLTDYALITVGRSGALREGLRPRDLANPLWLAPEGFDDVDPTVATDVYSLGCIMFWMLTGQPPFTGGELGWKHKGARRPDVRDLNPEISEPTATIVERCMRADLHRRLREPRQLVRFLRASLERLPAHLAELERRREAEEAEDDAADEDTLVDHGLQAAVADAEPTGDGLDAPIDFDAPLDLDDDSDSDPALPTAFGDSDDEPLERRHDARSEDPPSDSDEPLIID